MKIIEKEYLVCNLCNHILVDENGKVLKDFAWTDWGLICRNKLEEIGEEDFEVIEWFKEGEKISKSHQVFAPMKIMGF